MQGTEVDEDDEVQVKRKAKVDPKDMKRLTHQNYRKLPEIV